MRAEQFKEITEWQRKTFPKATSLSKIAHLAEELQELVDDLKSGNPKRRLEWADCFLLLFGGAAADGMSYEDCCNCISEKFEIVKLRKCGEPDANGVVKHIKSNSLTREEAMEAMLQGKKVRHRYFSDEEYMTIENGKILLEDGVKCSYEEFWKYRNLEGWKDGYELVAV